MWLATPSSVCLCLMRPGTFLVFSMVSAKKIEGLRGLFFSAVSEGVDRGVRRGGGSEILAFWRIRWGVGWFPTAGRRNFQ